MSNLFFSILASLSLGSGLLLIASVKTKRERRAEQLGMIVLAAIYLLVSLVILYRFNNVIFSALEAIDRILDIGTLRPGTTTVYMLENVFLLVLFAVLKLVFIFVFRAIFKRWREPISEAIANIYEYNPDDGVWFISTRLADQRRYLRGLYWTSVALVLLFTTLLLAYPQWPAFAGIAFPALAALLIGEIFFALDGITRQEYSKGIEGEQDSAMRVANYNPLRNVFRETFPDRVLSDDVHLASRAALGSGYRIGELTRSTDEEERLAGSYFSRLRNAQTDIDVNLVESAVDLLHEKSVLINNPFYLDLTPYISLPAYHTLLQSRRVLIVAGRDSLVTDLEAWITAGLEDVTGIPDLWNIEVLTEISPANIHVGILPFADVHNLDLMRAHSDFLADVEMVVLAEPSRMMATGQLGLSMLLSACGSRRRPTFVAFDGNHDGLVDALSHLLKTSFTEVIASALPQGASAEAVWTTVGQHMHVQVLPRISRFTGMGTEIGAVALKYQVPRFHWVGGDAFPVLDMRWIAEQYYAQINAFADLDLSQDALRDAFTAVANPWDLAQDDNYFMIIEDESANAFETIRKYATRARMSGFVNLLTDEYLLRDYMISNRELFSADPKAIPSIVPDFARTERNLALRLLMQMSWSEVTEEQINQEFELIGIGLPAGAPEIAEESWQEREPYTVRRLRNLITEHTNVLNPGIRQLTGFELRQMSDRESGMVFRIDESPELADVLKTLQPAYFYVEDEVGGINRIGSLLFDHVYQAMLPGQFVTYGGKYYEVQGISADDSRSGVVLRRAADHIHDRRSYRQWRDFTISDIADQDPVGSTTQRDGLQMRRAVASIHVVSHGYYELSNRSDLNSAKTVRVDGIPDRKYTNKAILEIRMPDLEPRVRKTITLLLNELMITVFPNGHPYVVALTSDEDKSFGSLLTCTDGEIDPECIYIVEDSMIDLGLGVAVERNWTRLMEIITDYLNWYTSSEEVRPEPEKPEKQFQVEIPEVPSPIRRDGWWKRLIRRVRGSRDGGSPEASESSTPTVQTPADAGRPEPEEAVESEFVARSSDELVPDESPDGNSEASEVSESDVPENSDNEATVDALPESVPNNDVGQDDGQRETEQSDVGEAPKRKSDTGDEANKDA